MKRSILWLCIVFIAFSASVVSQSAEDPCRSPEAAAFDFQIGVWASSSGKDVHEISKVPDGCSIEETWRVDGKVMARAIKSFDNGNHDKNKEKRWYYTWTARGFHQLWEGRKEDGGWRFYRSWWLDGQPILSRTYWVRLNANSLERIVEQSRDGGKTWRPHVRDAFTRRAP